MDIGQTRLVRETWKPTSWALRLTKTTPWEATIGDELLVLRIGERQRKVPLWSIHDVMVISGIVWAGCRITLQPSPDDGPASETLHGLSKADAPLLADRLRNCVGQRLSAAVVGAKPLAEEWLVASRQALRRDRWIRQSEIAEQERRRDALSAPGTTMTLRQLFEHPLRGATHPAINDIYERTFSDELRVEASVRNAAFLERELEAHRIFFDNVEPNPLTQEQAEAAICFDDRVRLIAAAGSGKTSTMVARAGYACLTGIARPDEILMLAFNDEAAKELKARVRDRLNLWVPEAQQITASTFHSFGLRVIGEATGKKPSVPGWLNKGLDLKMISEIISDLAASDEWFKAQWELFTAVFGRDIGVFRKQSPEAAFSSTGPDVIRTLRGEVVKSFEEKTIADWLAYHGVRYVYERPYPIDTADQHHCRYHPDFYYPDIDLYHEHFALDRYGNPPPHFENYAEGVVWKRGLHAMHHTHLVETTSHTLRTGEAFEHLKAELKDRGLRVEPSLSNLEPGAQQLSVSAMLKIVRTFLSHFKGNRCDMLEIKVAADKTSAYPVRARVFLGLFERVLEEWNRRLAEGGGVDFDDMLNQAADLIESGAWVSPFTVVAVDEWQDTSAARARIVRALSRRGVSVAVIGDDFQGIYRFAGADIRYMTDFETLIGPATTRFLTETFRCPQHLIDVATAFIRRNPAQVRKEVRSHNPMIGRSTRLLLHHRGQLPKVLAMQIGRLAQHARALRQHFSVYLLGRYHHNLPDNLLELQALGGEDLAIRFATVHQSKGLEADYVLVLGVHEGQLGFPCKVDDDLLFDLVMPGADPFPHAEERRLFYVALTRARRRVLILAEASLVSPFMRELVDLDAGEMMMAIEQIPVSQCPSCQEGLLVPNKGRYGMFLGCTRSPACRYRENLDAETSSTAP